MKKKRNTRVVGPWRRSPLGLAMLLAIVAALLVAGCGGSSDDGTSEDTSASSSEQSGGSGGGPGGFEIDDEARACLEESGVEIPEMGEGEMGGEPPQGEMPPSGEAPEGGEPPQGFGGEDQQKAFEECGIDMSQGGGGPGGADTDSPEFRESIEEYVACVRENGYDLPDPNLSGEGPVFKESEVDQDDPDFKAANEECQSLIGGAGGEGGSGGGEG